MIPEGTRELIGQLLGNTFRYGELIDWAVQALVDGFDTRALRRLAGLDLDTRRKEAREAVSLFEEALEELGIPIPEREAGLRDHLILLAKGIVAGTISPRKASSE